MKPVLGTQLNTVHQLNKGLVGRWLMNERAGLVVKDISGHKNHGNFASGGVLPTWGPGVYGGGVDFIDTNEISRIALNNSITLGVGTIIIDVMLRVVNPTNHNMIAGGFDTNNFISVFGPDILRLRNASGADINWDPVVTWESDRMYNIAITNDDTNYELFIDSVSYGEITKGDDIVINIFGKGFNSGTFGLDGQIDNVGIYNRVLSPSEIKQLYLSK